MSGVTVSAHTSKEIDAQYQTAHAQVIAQMQIEHLEPLTTEDDILAAAVILHKPCIDSCSNISTTTTFKDGKD